MRRALIVGSEGQDGRILFDRLTAEGAAVLGLGRGTVRGEDAAAFRPVTVESRAEVTELLERWPPDEIYYLPAVHQSAQDASAADDATLFERSVAVHVTGIVNFLEVTRRSLTDTGVFYAASSLVFGDVSQVAQNESTPMNPTCVYGITKSAGIHACRYYRATHGVRVSAGVLYNHESPLRRPTFVSKKITTAAVEIADGRRDKLVVGDLAARVDWGYAPDYVDAMVRIVRNGIDDDYVVATGEAHSVQEFVEIAFARAGLDWREHIVENHSLLSRRGPSRVGDSSMLRERTGWKPSVSFVEMVHLLVDSARASNAA